MSKKLIIEPTKSILYCEFCQVRITHTEFWYEGNRYWRCDGCGNLVPEDEYLRRKDRPEYDQGVREG